MRTVTRYVGGDFNWPGTYEEREVVCDDDAATKARFDWLADNGFATGDAHDVQSVSCAWLTAKGSLNVYERDEQKEMDAIEYFNPYDNGSNWPEDR